MTDPWARFEEGAARAEAAGYFERVERPGAATAHWFVDEARVATVDRNSQVEELRGRCSRFLSSPSRAVVGYVGFDAVGLFEPALRSFPTGSPFPLGELAFVRRLRSARVRPPTPEASQLDPPGRPLERSLSRRGFEAAVRRLVRAIRDGEAFQVVLAQRRSWPRPDDLLARAAELRRRERYAYFYYLRFGDREILGASPESVVELRGRTAWVDPIAGTLPTTGRQRRLPLRADPKELAEHRMLVDLARNDLGQVAVAGSVHLAFRERRETFARLEHLVSRVAGTVDLGRGPWDVLGSTFPAGTVSGAPKIRAVQLLREEEATWRGPYAGAVGLLQGRGRASWALGIRTAFAAGDRLHTAAGAGVVHRSQPAREYLETLQKLSLVESVTAGGVP